MASEEGETKLLPPQYHLSEVSNDDLPETEEQELARIRGAKYWVSYCVVTSVSFFGFIDYSVIMPSAEGYCKSLGQSSTFYGISLSVFPLARILFLPVAGFASDRYPMRMMLAFSVGLQLMGGITYAMAAPADWPGLLLFGRLIAGIGSTNIAIFQKFIVSTSTLAGRSKAIAVMQAINFLGIALGPAVNYGLPTVDLDAVPPEDNSIHLFGKLYFNEYTGAGLLLACGHTVNLCLVVLLFADPPAAKASNGQQELHQRGICHNLVTGFKGVARTPGALGVGVTAMLAMLWLSLLETLVSPVTKVSSCALVCTS